MPAELDERDKDTPWYIWGPLLLVSVAFACFVYMWYFADEVVWWHCLVGILTAFPIAIVIVQVRFIPHPSLCVCVCVCARGCVCSPRVCALLPWSRCIPFPPLMLAPPSLSLSLLCARGCVRSACFSFSLLVSLLVPIAFVTVQVRTSVFDPAKTFRSTHTHTDTNTYAHDIKTPTNRCLVARTGTLLLCSPS